jgi:hypothetical protein
MEFVDIQSATLEKIIIPASVTFNILFLGVYSELPSTSNANHGDLTLPHHFTVRTPIPIDRKTLDL